MQLLGVGWGLECLTYGPENKGDLDTFQCERIGQLRDFMSALTVFGSVYWISLCYKSLNLGSLCSDVIRYPSDTWGMFMILCDKHFHVKCEAPELWGLQSIWQYQFKTHQDKFLSNNVSVLINTAILLFNLENRLRFFLNIFFLLWFTTFTR